MIINVIGAVNLINILTILTTAVYTDLFAKSLLYSKRVQIATRIWLVLAVILQFVWVTAALIAIASRAPYVTPM